MSNELADSRPSLKMRNTVSSSLTSLEGSGIGSMSCSIFGVRIPGLGGSPTHMLRDESPPVFSAKAASTEILTSFAFIYVLAIAMFAVERETNDAIYSSLGTPSKL